jgi:hypothetical protein
MVPVLSHMNSVYTLTLQFCKVFLILSSHLSLGQQSVIFPSCLSTKLCMYFLSLLLESVLKMLETVATQQ